MITKDSLNNFKYYKFVALLIGTISLIGSFYSIYKNLLPTMGLYYAIATPISADILIIYLMFSSISLIERDKKRLAIFFRYYSYLLSIGSWYLNILDSIKGNNISIPSLIGHSFFVLAWITCSEILVDYAKDLSVYRQEKRNKEQFIINQKRIIEEEKEKEVYELELERKNRILEKERLEHEIDIKKKYKEVEREEELFKIKLQKEEEVSYKQKLNELEKQFNIINKQKKEDTTVSIKTNNTSKKNKQSVEIKELEDVLRW